MKRMKNKLHGFTHVYNDAEEKSHREHGWVEESEPYPGETKAPAEPEQTASDMSANMVSKPRRGRPPVVKAPA